MHVKQFVKKYRSTPALMSLSICMQYFLEEKQASRKGEAASRGTWMIDQVQFCSSKYRTEK
jgi:hypothetical protein